MSNHKRKGPKSNRSGCMLCKPHKHQGMKKSYNNQIIQEKKAIMDEKEQIEEDYGAAAVLYFDNAHDGPGWYFYDLCYPEEGSCGSFETKEEACKFAEENGYVVEETYS